METAASLTPLGLFLQAGTVAKIVILLLLGASIWCWVLIIEAAWSIARLRRAIKLARQSDPTGPDALLFPVVDAGRRAESLTIPGESFGEARVRVAEAMGRAAQRLLARIEGGLPNLAVISSVAPFIGLFGTVWGIMVSFSSIADAKDTSLAVVAPGIAEALAATAVGLAAAIPATIGYNRLGASLARAGQDLQHVIEEDAITITAHRVAAPGTTAEAR
jgi:biopolymer transport protein ExbB/TolQ